MDDTVKNLSTLYDNAFKDGVDFCIEVLQSYGNNSDEIIQYIKDVYDIMMGKMEKKGN